MGIVWISRIHTQCVALCCSVLQCVAVGILWISRIHTQIEWLVIWMSVVWRSGSQEYRPCKSFSHGQRDTQNEWLFTSIGVSSDTPNGCLVNGLDSTNECLRMICLLTLKMSDSLPQSECQATLQQTRWLVSGLDSTNECLRMIGLMCHDTILTVNRHSNWLRWSSLYLILSVKRPFNFQGVVYMALTSTNECLRTISLLTLKMSDPLPLMWSVYRHS